MSRRRSTSTTPNQKKGWRKFLDGLTYKDKTKWLKDMRGGLSLTASIIATITFQSALNPPGGVAQASDNNYNCRRNKTNPICPGQAVLAVTDESRYLAFLICNTICFVASLSVCLLLVSGLPLDHKIPTWSLLIGMCITLTSLALTYVFGAAMLNPGVSKLYSVFAIVIYVWVGLVLIIALLLTLRFAIWFVDKYKHNRSSTSSRGKQEISSNPA